MKTDLSIGTDLKYYPFTDKMLSWIAVSYQSTQTRIILKLGKWKMYKHHDVIPVGNLCLIYRSSGIKTELPGFSEHYFKK